METLPIRTETVKSSGPAHQGKWRALVRRLEAAGQDEKWSARQGQLVRLAESAGDQRRVNYLLAAVGELSAQKAEMDSPRAGGRWGGALG